MPIATARGLILSDHCQHEFADQINIINTKLSIKAAILIRHAAHQLDVVLLGGSDGVVKATEFLLVIHAR